jgi:hypothetical protein
MCEISAQAKRESLVLNNNCVIRPLLLQLFLPAQEIQVLLALPRVKVAVLIEAELRAYKRVKYFLRLFDTFTFRELAFRDQPVTPVMSCG